MVHVMLCVYSCACDVLHACIRVLHVCIRVCVCDLVPCVHVMCFCVCACVSVCKNYGNSRFCVLLSLLTLPPLDLFNSLPLFPPLITLLLSPSPSYFLLPPLPPLDPSSYHHPSYTLLLFPPLITPLPHVSPSCLSPPLIVSFPS